MTMNAHFQFADESVWQDTADAGVRRMILGYGPDLMMVRVVFETGAVGALHHHPHRQGCYVASGVFDVTIDGVTKRLRAGDSYFVPVGDMVHGATCVEAGELIDAFTPLREDFLAAG
jgi:quercetin dioxygenase-like cupin family protein